MCRFALELKHLLMLILAVCLMDVAVRRPTRSRNTDHFPYASWGWPGCELFVVHCAFVTLERAGPAGVWNLGGTI